jgi:FkbM family methyltransferase
VILVAKETTSNKDKVQGRAKGDRANTMTDKDYFTESHRIRKVGLLLLIPFVLGLIAVVASLILGSGICNRDELYRNNEMILNRPSNNYDKDDDDDTAKEVSFTKSTADAYLEPVDCLALLDLYRNKKISQLRGHTVALPYHKSYVRLTTTEIPFYLSTSDKRVDNIRSDIFQNGDYYENIMTTTMQTILKGVSNRMENKNNRPIMLDVGGNVGWFSMLSAAHGAEVFVFEPNVVNMIRLCESSVLNGWSLSSNAENNQVHPYLKGVNDVHGEELVMYKVDPSNPGSFSFSKEHSDKSSILKGGAHLLEDILQMVTLDALAQDQHWLEDDNNTTIAILKIDVEGLELKVLSGAQKLLNSHKVQYIFLEWKITEVHRWEAMATILLNAGYVLYKFGAWLGPGQFITNNTQYFSKEMELEMRSNGKDLAKHLASVVTKTKWENTNVLFRLADINDTW